MCDRCASCKGRGITSCRTREDFQKGALGFPHLDLGMIRESQTPPDALRAVVSGRLRLETRSSKGSGIYALVPTTPHFLFLVGRKPNYDNYSLTGL